MAGSRVKETTDVKKQKGQGKPTRVSEGAGLFMEDLWAAMTLDLISALEKLKSLGTQVLSSGIFLKIHHTPWDQNWTHRNDKRLGTPTEDLGKN